MVRAAALIAIILLAACNQSPATSTRDLADVADANSRNALVRISDLSSRIEELERKVEQQDRLIRAYAASLDEARSNHTNLLNTFNDNVDKSNKRDRGQDMDIAWLFRQHGVSRPN